jgi:hypothetical protein
VYYAKRKRGTGSNRTSVEFSRFKVLFGNGFIIDLFRMVPKILIQVQTPAAQKTMRYGKLAL